MESKEYKKKKGDVEISLLAYKDGNNLNSVCCGIINVNGDTIDAHIGMDEYGLYHNYRGDAKANVDSALKSIQTSLANDYNLTFEKRPEQTENEVMPPMEEETPNAE